MADNEVQEQYRTVINKLQKQMNETEEELQALEDSGDAAEHPEKHEQALAKTAEIKEQLQELKNALGEDQ